jgi:hypothetical protein
MACLDCFRTVQPRLGPGVFAGCLGRSRRHGPGRSPLAGSTTRALPGRNRPSPEKPSVDAAAKPPLGPALPRGPTWFRSARGGSNAVSLGVLGQPRTRPFFRGQRSHGPQPLAGPGPGKNHRHSSLPSTALRPCRRSSPCRPMADFPRWARQRQTPDHYGLASRAGWGASRASSPCRPCPAGAGRPNRSWAAVAAAGRTLVKTGQVTPDGQPWRTVALQPADEWRPAGRAPRRLMRSTPFPGVALGCAIL